MLISVVIPTYNRAYCLKRALDSVFSQPIRNLEVIVVDDGSTDTTAKLCRQYPELHYHYQANQGVSAARNVGINKAKGQWIALLDSDDAWAINKLTAQTEALNGEPTYKMCHTNEIWYRQQRRVNPMKKHTKQGGLIFEACLQLCLISPSSVLIHRSIFDDVGLFDESLLACEDYDMWLRITACYPVLYLPQPLTIKYGGHPDQLSKKYWGMDRFRIKAITKILDQDILNAKQRQSAIKVLQTKIDIYCQGAAKRNKKHEIETYAKLKHQYCNSLSD